MVVLVRKDNLMTKEELKDKIKVVRSSLLEIVWEVEGDTKTFTHEDWEKISLASGQ
jgi:hypothetical protein